MSCSRTQMYAGDLFNINRFMRQYVTRILDSISWCMACWDQKRKQDIDNQNDRRTRCPFV